MRKLKRSDKQKGLVIIMKDKSVIIGFTGATGSGKTMLCKVFLKQMGFTILSITDEIYDFAKSFRGIGRETFDEKNRDSASKKLGGRTPREFLRDINELGRKYSEGRLCWVESLFEKKIRLIPDGAMIAIHDINYKNEIDYIRSKGGYAMHLQRMGHDSPTKEFDSIAFDKTLLAVNNSTPQDLERFAYEVVEWSKKVQSNG